MGIADVARFLPRPPSRRLSAVAFALRYPDPQVELLPDDRELHQAIEDLASKAGRIYSLIERSILRRDDRARCCRCGGVEEVFGKLTTPLSQKAVAVIAGLGWIGKSSLLITEACGPRVRLGTMFTDAPLVADAPFQANNCRGCRICLDVCPAGAVTGQRSDFEDLCAFRIDSQACCEHLCRNEAAIGRREFCGLCVKECPFGRTPGR